MKQGIHAKNYRPVVFQDSNDGSTFITRSTVAAEETVVLDGVEYPLVKVHISSSSHPFFTGEERIVDVEGRVDKFKARQKAAEVAKDAKTASAASRKSKVDSRKSEKPRAQKLGVVPADQKTKDAGQKTEKPAAEQ